MVKFKILKGTYAENSVICKANSDNDTIESDKDLNKLFPGRFERVAIIEKKVINIEEPKKEEPSKVVSNSKKKKKKKKR